MSKKVFFPYLDSLRFVAFFLVFWHHSFAYVVRLLPSPSQFFSNMLKAWTDTGGEGVHIFFVLSGFLITYLLVEEAKEFGSINIPHFYIRRILRIWPLYYFILINTIFKNARCGFILSGRLFIHLNALQVELKRLVTVNAV